MSGCRSPDDPGAGGRGGGCGSTRRLFVSGDTNTGGVPARDVDGSFLEADGRKRPGRSVPSGCSPDRAGARRGRAMCLGGPRRRTQAGPDRGSRQPADSCREPGGRLDGPFRVLRGGSPRSAARRGGASRISGHRRPQEAGIALYGPLRASQADFAPDRTGRIARSGRERPFRERIRAWPAARSARRRPRSGPRHPVRDHGARPRPFRAAPVPARRGRSPCTFLHLPRRVGLAVQLPGAAIRSSLRPAVRSGGNPAETLHPDAPRPRS